MLVAFRGVFHVIEVKTPGEKPSAKQLKTIKEMEGCPVHVVYSVGDALRAIGAIGEPKNDDK